MNRGTDKPGAAQSLNEAIERALNIALLSPVRDYINITRNELKDYIAHRVMIMDENALAIDLFKEIFGSDTCKQKNN